MNFNMALSQDLFKQGGTSRWYAVSVDHNSDWFEVDLLNEDTTAANVLSVIKAYFSRKSVPDKFLSNNRPHKSLKSCEACPGLRF